MKLTQIGAGAIGSFYIDHLRRGGVELLVYDSSDERRRSLAAVGVAIETTVAGAVREAEVVLVALPNPEADRACLQGPQGAIAAARSGVLFIDLSTIDADTARQNYSLAKQRGSAYIEAPVSGGEPMSAGTDGARQGNITFMAAGDKEAFDRAVPIMRMLGKHTLYLGEIGTGAIVKLISNHIAGLINLVVAEAFALGRAASLDPELLFRVFEHTDANSFWLFNYFEPRIRRRDFKPGFSVDLMYKDHRLTEDLARQLKVPMPLNALALQLYQIIRAQGRGDRDLVEAANLMADLAHQQRFDVPPEVAA